MSTRRCPGLDRGTFGGIWVGLPTPFDEHDRLDPGAVAEAVRIAAAWGVTGVYTTGSTGEWYAIDDDEFAVLIEALDIGRTRAGAEGHHILTQAGVTSTSTRGAVRRAEVAAARGVDSLQVAFPSWIPLRDDECVGFLADVAGAVTGVPLVHYNVGRAGRRVDGPLYRRIADAVPEVIGAKITGSDDGLWASLRRHADDLGFLVGETLLPARMADGARGTCSSYIYYAPALMTRLYGASAAGRYEDAAAIGGRFRAFERDAIEPLAADGYVDAAIDKAFAAAAGHLPIRPSVRGPYRGVSSGRVATLRELITTSYPDFLEVPRSSSGVESVA